jgi:hypothetical protein
MDAQNQRQPDSLRFGELIAGRGVLLISALLLTSLSLSAQQPDAAAKQEMVQEKVAAPESSGLEAVQLDRNH